MHELEKAKLSQSVRARSQRRFAGFVTIASLGAQQRVSVETNEAGNRASSGDCGNSLSDCASDSAAIQFLRQFQEDGSQIAPVHGIVARGAAIAVVNVGNRREVSIRRANREIRCGGIVAGSNAGQSQPGPHPQHLDYVFTSPVGSFTGVLQ